MSCFFSVCIVMNMSCYRVFFVVDSLYNIIQCRQSVSFISPLFLQLSAENERLKSSLADVESALRQSEVDRLQVQTR